MKIFLCFLALFPLSAMALEVSDVRLVRMLNGQNYQCREKYEVGKTSYFPEIKNASADDSAVSFSIDVSFAFCAQAGESLLWQARRPLDPILGKDMDSNPTRLEFSEPDFFLGTDGFQPVQLIPAANEPSQTISLVAPLKVALTPGQRQEFAKGKAVAVHLLLIGRWVGTFISKSGTTPLGRQQGQAYTLFFTLKK